MREQQPRDDPQEGWRKAGTLWQVLSESISHCHCPGVGTEVLGGLVLAFPIFLTSLI